MKKQLHELYLKQVGIKIPKNNRYDVYYQDRYAVKIVDNKTSKATIHNSNEFTMYTLNYNESVYNYPNYVINQIMEIIC